MKTQWDWNKWLAALALADVPKKAKELGRAIPAAMRRTRHALVPWELPGNPTYADLTPLVYAGLLHQIPAVGQFVPVIDPLPAPNSIGTSAAGRRILRLLLSGRDLRYTQPGSDRGAPGWEMRRDIFSCVRIDISPRAARRLLDCGLIEWSGCGTWPRFLRKHYRVNMRRLCGVKGFRAAGLRWVEERTKDAA